MSNHLNAKNVIHTVGPRWNKGKSNETEKLKNCYLSSLRLAEEHDLKTIAFPNISTGIYRFPKEQAAEIAIKTVSTYHSEVIETVIFVCFDEENHQLYQKKLGD